VHEPVVGHDREQHGHRHPDQHLQRVRPVRTRVLADPELVTLPELPHVVLERRQPVTPEDTCRQRRERDASVGLVGDEDPARCPIVDEVLLPRVDLEAAVERLPDGDRLRLPCAGHARLPRATAVCRSP
jgi:hypothetical protein